MLTLNDGRSELWQWDTGRTLAVDAECSQVHFSNKVFGRSIDVDVAEGVAIIPDVLLQTDKDLNVWAFVGTAENGYTKISKTFKVNKRNKPADYVFTPPDQATLAELSGRLDRIEESQDPDAIKNAVKDYLTQNPVEIPVQSVNGQTGAVELTAEDVGAISQDDLQAATNAALAQAKASGEFDGPQGPSGPAGDDGKTPEYGVDYGTPEQIAGIAQYAAEILRPEVSQLKDDLSGLEQTIKGKYTKPSGGIPASDLASGVIPTIPQKLPTPNKLTFTGAATGEFDGSSPLSIEIPQGGDGGGGTLRKIVDITLEQDVNVLEVIPGEMLPGLYLMDCYYTATAQNKKEESAIVQMNCGNKIANVDNQYCIRTNGVIRSLNFIVVGTNVVIMYGGSTGNPGAVVRQSEQDSFCYGLKIVANTITQYVATGTIIKVYAVLVEE